MTSYATHSITFSSIEISTLVGSIARTINDLTHAAVKEKNQRLREGFVRDIERLSMMMDRLIGLLPDLQPDVAAALEAIQQRAAGATGGVA